jgi:hypothetical protein
MLEPRKELPVPLGESDEIRRVSSPRHLERVSAIGEKPIHDAFSSIERCDMEGCPSLFVLGIDIGSPFKKRTRRRKRLV